MIFMNEIRHLEIQIEVLNGKVTRLEEEITSIIDASSTITADLRDMIHDLMRRIEKLEEK
jgi:ubiquinone biosynthesis protein UbiJ